MKRLIDVARGLKPGERIRIRSLAVDGSPEGRKQFSPSLTDAQIYAYQDKVVLSVTRSEGGKELLCVVMDEQELAQYFPEQ